MYYLYMHALHSFYFHYTLITSIMSPLFIEHLDIVTVNFETKFSCLL